MATVNHGKCTKANAVRKQSNMNQGRAKRQKLLGGAAVLLSYGLAFGGESISLPVSPDLTAAWWQWALSIPASVHPLIDESGINCPIGQHGEVWFLGGSFSVSESPKLEVVRSCRIPFGVRVLMPVLNVECSTAEGDAKASDSFSQKVRKLRACAQSPADSIEEPTATFNGKPLQVRRVFTSVPYSFSFPANPWRADLDKNAPNPSLSMSDGYWVQVLPPPGEHELKVKANVGDFFQDITYKIDVVPVRNQ
jgi:hypothetical protein